MKPVNSAVIHVRLDKDVKKKISKMAEADGRTVSAFVALALRRLAGMDVAHCRSIKTTSSDT